MRAEIIRKKMQKTVLKQGVQITLLQVLCYTGIVPFTSHIL